MYENQNDMFTRLLKAKLASFYPLNLDKIYIDIFESLHHDWKEYS